MATSLSKAQVHSHQGSRHILPSYACLVLHHMAVIRNSQCGPTQTPHGLYHLQPCRAPPPSSWKANATTCYVAHRNISSSMMMPLPLPFQMISISLFSIAITYIFYTLFFLLTFLFMKPKIWYSVSSLPSLEDYKSNTLSDVCGKIELWQTVVGVSIELI